MSIAALDPSSSALLVIDMQNAWCHPEGTLGMSGVELGGVQATIPPIRRLAEAFRERGLPVIWTIQEHHLDDVRRTSKRLTPHTAKRARLAAQAGTWDAEIVSELADLADDPQLVIRKHRYGCFYETRLELLLGMLGVDSLIVTGATANACVETTLREAYLRDFDQIAVTDCIGAIDSEWGRVAEKVWAQYLCELGTSAEVLDWLEGAHDEGASAGGVRELGHLLLQVSDLAAAERFYLETLGFAVRKREPFRDGRPLIVTEQGLGLTDGRPEGQGPLEHLAFRVDGVHALAERAGEAGYEIIREPAPSAYGISVYIADPDANQVELFEPEPAPRGSDGDGDG